MDSVSPIQVPGSFPLEKVLDGSEESLSSTQDLTGSQGSLSSPTSPVVIDYAGAMRTVRSDLDKSRDELDKKIAKLSKVIEPVNRYEKKC